MIPGLNHNIRYREKVFHVQTEDSGLSRCQLTTHIFYEGSVIAHERTPYAPGILELGDDVERANSVRKQMQEQHRRLLKSLVSGERDDILVKLGLLPPEVIVEELPPEPGRLRRMGSVPPRTLEERAREEGLTPESLAPTLRPHVVPADPGPEPPTAPIDLEVEPSWASPPLRTPASAAPPPLPSLPSERTSSIPPRPGPRPSSVPPPPAPGRMTPPPLPRRAGATAPPAVTTPSARPFPPAPLPSAPLPSAPQTLPASRIPSTPAPAEQRPPPPASSWPPSPQASWPPPSPPALEPSWPPPPPQRTPLSASKSPSRPQVAQPREPTTAPLMTRLDPSASRVPSGPPTQPRVPAESPISTDTFPTERPRSKRPFTRPQTRVPSARSRMPLDPSFGNTIQELPTTDAWSEANALSGAIAPAGGFSPPITGPDALSGAIAPAGGFSPPITGPDALSGAIAPAGPDAADTGPLGRPPPGAQTPSGPPAGHWEQRPNIGGVPSPRRLPAAFHEASTLIGGGRSPPSSPPIVRGQPSPAEEDDTQLDMPAIPRPGKAPSGSEDIERPSLIADLSDSGLPRRVPAHPQARGRGAPPAASLNALGPLEDPAIDDALLDLAPVDDTLLDLLGTEGLKGPGLPQYPSLSAPPLAGASWLEAAPELSSDPGRRPSSPTAPPAPRPLSQTRAGVPRQVTPPPTPRPRSVSGIDTPPPARKTARPSPVPGAPRPIDAYASTASEQRQSSIGPAADWRTNARPSDGLQEAQPRSASTIRRVDERSLDDIIIGYLSTKPKREGEGEGGV